MHARLAAWSKNLRCVSSRRQHSKSQQAFNIKWRGLKRGLTIVLHSRLQAGHLSPECDYDTLTQDQLNTGMQHFTAELAGSHARASHGLKAPHE